MARVVIENWTDTADLVFRWRREWTCPLHESRAEDPNDHYCDCGYCTYESDWEPEPGCLCFDGAKWVTHEGELEIVLEPVLNRVLKHYYMPAIMETLNQESILLQSLGR
jgi:hypothetical protein